MAPSVERVAFLCNAENPTTKIYEHYFNEATATLSVKPVSGLMHGDIGEIETFLDSFAREPNGGVLVPPDVLITVHRERIVAAAARHRLPAIYSDRSLVTAGGLAYYGVERIDLHRRAATYVDRIFKGERPADLPVQQPTKYEFAINLKTADALISTFRNHCWPAPTS